MEIADNDINSSANKDARDTIHVTLKGDDKPYALKMIDKDGLELDVVLSKKGKYWFADFLSIKRILKHSQIDFILQDGAIITLEINTGAVKFPTYWRTVAVIKNDQLLS